GAELNFGEGWCGEPEMRMLRGVIVWCAFMAIETVHGILRGIFLVPRVGLNLSNKIGWPVAACIVFGMTVLTFRWIGLVGTKALLRLGVIWVVPTDRKSVG